jgi:hypothetical protein
MEGASSSPSPDSGSQIARVDDFEVPAMPGAPGAQGSRLVEALNLTGLDYRERPGRLELERTGSRQPARHALHHVTLRPANPNRASEDHRARGRLLE